MSKLCLILSLSMMMTIGACASPPPGDGGEAVESEEVSELSATGDSCADKLANDNDACTAAYNTCMSSAQSWVDKAACAVSRAACMTEAAAKYVRCIKDVVGTTTVEQGPVEDIPAQDLP